MVLQANDVAREVSATAVRCYRRVRVAARSISIRSRVLEGAVRTEDHDGWMLLRSVRRETAVHDDDRLVSKTGIVRDIDGSGEYFGAVGVGIAIASGLGSRGCRAYGPHDIWFEVLQRHSIQLSLNILKDLRTPLDPPVFLLVDRAAAIELQHWQQRIARCIRTISANAAHGAPVSWTGNDAGIRIVNRGLRLILGGGIVRVPVAPCCPYDRVSLSIRPVAFRSRESFRPRVRRSRWI